MKTSCGVVIINELNEIFMGHSTGNNFYDIPKGLLEEGENELSCVIRECKEETSIDLSDKNLESIGLYPYNKEKNLYLFLVSIKKQDINLNTLVCNSFFEDYYTKKLKPEIDNFKWISIQEVKEKCSKSMGILLEKLIEKKVIQYKELNNKFKI
jgi:8-oxo-dGTP pyrophosphatase MutT (NUDIX family)